MESRTTPPSRSAASLTPCWSPTLFFLFFFLIFLTNGLDSFEGFQVGRNNEWEARSLHTRPPTPLTGPIWQGCRVAGTLDKLPWLPCHYKVYGRFPPRGLNAGVLTNVLYSPVQLPKDGSAALRMLCPLMKRFLPLWGPSPPSSG